jgi:hypothetical protein
MSSLPPAVLPCQRALCSALPGGDLVGAHTGIWRCAHRLECLRWIPRAPLWCSVFYLFKNRFAEKNTGTGAPMNDTGAPMNECAHFASSCQLVQGLRPSASESLPQLQRFDSAQRHAAWSDIPHLKSLRSGNIRLHHPPHIRRPGASSGSRSYRGLVQRLCAARML